MFLALLLVAGAYFLGRKHGSAVKSYPPPTLDPAYIYDGNEWAVYMDNVVWTPSGVFLARGRTEVDAARNGVRTLRLLIDDIETRKIKPKEIK